MEKVWEFVTELGMTVGVKLIYAALILIIGFKLTRVLVRLVKKNAHFTRLDGSLQAFLSGALRIALYLLVVITAAYVVGVPTASFVTVLASAGVAVGLALQGALSNFVGGLMLLFFKPFKTGDFIDAGTEKGYVQRVTVFYTTLLTRDNRQLVLPNGALTNAALINHSAEENRRVELTFCVSYQADIEQVKSLLLATAQAYPLVLKEPAPFAGLMKQGDSSLEFVLWAWTKNDNYWDVYFHLNEQGKKNLDANGVEIPYPQLDVHMKPE